eukprot:gene1662-2194_t
MKLDAPYEIDLEYVQRMMASLLFADLAQVWPKFDGFVHSIGFAPREAIAGDFLDGFTDHVGLHVLEGFGHRLS